LTLTQAKLIAIHFYIQSGEKYDTYRIQSVRQYRCLAKWWHWFPSFDVDSTVLCRAVPTERHNPQKLHSTREVEVFGREKYPRIITSTRLIHPWYPRIL